MQEKCAEKEGEVAILRTNLQKLRTSHQEEQEKKEKEWKDKLLIIQKESKAYKSELEFKVGKHHVKILVMVIILWMLLM